VIGIRQSENLEYRHGDWQQREDDGDLVSHGAIPA
jgi:hypothetical protein